MTSSLVWTTATFVTITNSAMPQWFIILPKLQLMLKRSFMGLSIHPDNDSLFGGIRQRRPLDQVHLRAIIIFL